MILFYNAVRLCIDFRQKNNNNSQNNNNSNKISPSFSPSVPSLSFFSLSLIAPTDPTRVVSANIAQGKTTKQAVVCSWSSVTGDGIMYTQGAVRDALRIMSSLMEPNDKLDVKIKRNSVLDSEFLL